MPIPPARDSLEIRPYTHDGQEGFLVEDWREQLGERAVLVPPKVLLVLSFLDGEREAVDVHREILAQYPDAALRVEDVESIAEDLDRHLILESERARKRRRELDEAFLAAPVRPSRHVPGGAEEIGRALDGLYAAEAGAGRIGERRAEPLAGIVAPHIDFARGGHCYTFAYKEVAERSDADLYVILGVSHLSPPNPFVVTGKDYATPFGPARADREAVAFLEKRLGAAIFDNEAVHRQEHSAEFQAVFLKHARPKADFTVLPILCSSFQAWCGDGSPSTAPRVADVLGALEELVAGRKACIVAGVDFAHVGPDFGDEGEVDQKKVQWMVEGDSRSLRACGELNPEAFWNSVTADGNARHVCGLSATYAALRLLRGSTGKLHKYGFAPAPAGGLVSFASMSFTRG